MPTFLSDPPQVVYLILGGLLVITALVAAQRQDRRAVIPFVVAFVLMFAVFLIDRLVESPREEAVRRTHMVAMATDAKNPEAFGEHLADKVGIAAGDGQPKVMTRDELKKHQFWNLLQGADVHTAVWGFDDVKSIDDSTVEIGFMGKGEVRRGQQMQIPVYFRATYTRQPDGSFKLTTLRTYEPLDHSKPFTIFGFP